MGSNAPSSVSAAAAVVGGQEEERDDDIVVVVTGFGPFKSQFPINPSWEITASLPTSLPITPPTTHHYPLSSSSARRDATTTTQSAAQRIRILIHPSPIRVSYATVRALVPQLWSAPPPPKIDFMVHVGMAGGRDYYSVERRGHRDGYVMADVDGVVWDDGDDDRDRDLVDRSGGDVEGGDLRNRPGEEDGRGDVEIDRKYWDGCPLELETDVDLDDVWTRWRAALPNIDVRPSEDAGHYLCDFIYYSSLAHLWKHHHDQERRVVFLHVPVESDARAIERGRLVLIELIRALVQSRRMGKVKNGGDAAVRGALEGRVWSG